MKVPEKIFEILLVILFYGCDKINPPYKKTQATTATFANARNVLLEEFTGHTCPNCPNAAVVVDSILNTVAYKGRVIPVAIHALSLSNPVNAPFTYNFQTPAGNEYATIFAPVGDPSAMFNRFNFGGGIVQTGSLGINVAWPADVQSFMNDTAAANIYIAVSNFIATPVVQASIYVNVNWLTNLTGNFNLCLEYTEDSIINTQLMPSGVINTKYVFMHVLRGALLPDFGLQIATSPTANSSWSNTYTCTMDSALVPKNCHIVAYVINSASNEVIQTQQANLITQQP